MTNKRSDRPIFLLATPAQRLLLYFPHYPNQSEPYCLSVHIYTVPARCSDSPLLFLHSITLSHCLKGIRGVKNYFPRPAPPGGNTYVYVASSSPGPQTANVSLLFLTCKECFVSLIVIVVPTRIVFRIFTFRLNSLFEELICNPIAPVHSKQLSDESERVRLC